MISVLKESVSQSEVLNNNVTSLSVVVGVLVSILLIIEALRSPIFKENINIQVFFQTMSFPIRTFLFKM